MIKRLVIAALTGIPLALALISLLQALGLGASESARVSWSLAELGRSWLHQDAWNMGSINFRETPSPFWLASPLVQVSLWLAISLALWLMLALKAQQPGLWLGAGLLVLFAWLVLDVHWQWQLAQRLADTWHDYAGLPVAERGHTKEPDASLARLAERVRAQVAEAGAASRVVMVTADPGGYVPLRARYHLLPLNMHPGLAQLPAPEVLKPGDFLYLILPPAGMRYSSESHQLVHGGHAISADLVFNQANEAYLFRVRDD
ncbi:hypothetical protein [Rhabdochromatium marinum]|uniref:hypothetical protein n=1 Tax=Rhabdochromatium marinum TaxID=48729 RepID=UPI00190856B4|nr:hypothetical protein [Rhabdochromatium marinum]MBK1647752.1 hypothetical protein [Rhabdochromatium marinum]